MKRIVRLTESDLARIVRRVIREDAQAMDAAQAAKLYTYYVSRSYEGFETIYATNVAPKFTYLKGAGLKKIFTVTGNFDYYSKNPGRDMSKVLNNPETFYLFCDSKNALYEDDDRSGAALVDRNGKIEELAKTACASRA